MIEGDRQSCESLILKEAPSQDTVSIASTGIAVLKYRGLKTTPAGTLHSHQESTEQLTKGDPARRRTRQSSQAVAASPSNPRPRGKKTEANSLVEILVRCSPTATNRVLLVTNIKVENKGKGEIENGHRRH